nr:MAG TPA: hypothetical protein [Caudoviricetes sp.]
MNKYFRQPIHSKKESKKPDSIYQYRPIKNSKS